MLPVSLLSLVALVAVAVAEPIHVPLAHRAVPRRRDANVIDPAHFAQARDFLLARYGYQRAGAKFRRAGQTVGIATINSVSACG